MLIYQLTTTLTRQSFYDKLLKMTFGVGDCAKTLQIAIDAEHRFCLIIQVYTKTMASSYSVIMNLVVILRGMWSNMMTML